MKKCFGFDPKSGKRGVDDILIGADVRPMDDGNLGAAGICLIDQAGFPRLATLQFNSDWVDQLLDQGTWESVIMHEIGHALGIGYWMVRGLVSKANAEPYCVYCSLGTNGNIGNGLIGRRAGEKAIIENEGGPGTALGHWKESVYTNELMTGYAEDSGPMPLSALTVYSMKDLGYTVDVSKAEPFTVSSSRRLREEKKHKFDYEATLVRPKVELVHGFPKPEREKEAEDLISKNAEQVKHLIDSKFMF